jgi:ethanolamine ammonia-lyase small subunit
MSSESLPEIVSRIRLRTPARLLSGRCGGGYRSATQLELRSAHAAARDAVRTDFDLQAHLGPELVNHFKVFEAHSQAKSKDEYLLRPDLGRRLSPESRSIITQLCMNSPNLQVAIGDGLSTTAISAQVPGLLPLLEAGAAGRGWSFGQVFAVHFCRVGILNEIGDLLAPRVAVLLIGERPGLATAESLSAYMAFRPHDGDTDAQRNLISNIHARGVSIGEAASRILRLAEQMSRLQISGVQIREQLAEAEIHPNLSIRRETSEQAE